MWRGALDAALDQHSIVAEARTGLAPRSCQRFFERGLVVCAPHPLAAAACNRLHQHRKADPARMGEQRRIVLLLAVVAGDHGHPGGFHQPLRRVLEAHRTHGGGRGADEDDSGGGACFDELRVLGQESVSGVHGLRSRCGRRLDHPLDVQVAPRGGRGAEPPRLARHGHVHRVPVRVGVDRDGAYAEPVRGAHHATGDFAAIGDEELPEHQGHLPRIPGGCAATEGVSGSAGVSPAWKTVGLRRVVHCGPSARAGGTPALPGRRRVTCGTRRSASPRWVRSTRRRATGRAPRGCGPGGRCRRPTVGRSHAADALRARTVPRWGA